METQSGKRRCAIGQCKRTALTSLERQALCLNHFLSRCYEGLERVDPRGRRFSVEPVDMASLRAFVEECSRKALDVSLQSKDLDNLQRGRLLDILLWAGELFVVLRMPRMTLAESLAASEEELSARAGALS